MSANNLLRLFWFCKQFFFRIFHPPPLQKNNGPSLRTGDPVLETPKKLSEHTAVEIRLLLILMLNFEILLILWNLLERFALIFTTIDKKRPWKNSLRLGRCSIGYREFSRKGPRLLGLLVTVAWFHSSFIFNHQYVHWSSTWNTAVFEWFSCGCNRISNLKINRIVNLNG